MKRVMAGVLALGLVAALYPGSAAADPYESDCSSLEVRHLLGGDLSGLTDDELLMRIGQVASGAGPGVRDLAHKALDGTIDDVRAFLETGWEAQYGHDIRVRVSQIAAFSGPEVKQEASDAMDEGTLEALEDFLLEHDCKPTPPETTTTSTTGPQTPLHPPTPDEPAAPAPQPDAEHAPAGVEAPPATPVHGAPNFTG